MPTSASRKKKAAFQTPLPPRPVRFSRILRTAETPMEGDRIPARRVLLWTVVGIAVLAGIVLYFKYERLLTPIVG